MKETLTINTEILVNVIPGETRVAIVEQGKLLELMIERTNDRGCVGNIFKGRVARVLPGLQAAFVDIGLERAGFLQVDEVFPERFDKDSDKSKRKIEKLLHEGQTLLVQAAKNPMGTKGARLTTQISLASRCLVYMPAARHVGISQRIAGAEERERLRVCVETVAGGAENGGFIARTAAEGASEAEIRKEVEYLRNLWGHLQEKAKGLAAPSGVYRYLALELRVLRDFPPEDLVKVMVDSDQIVERLLTFARLFNPEIENRIERYQGEFPLFYNFNVENELALALGRKVPLRSGGHLVIDQTEAMTTIDVNTGGFVGRRNLEETIYKTNLEAAHAIYRQLRLRNLGGIIIIDFIDMQDEEHRREVLRLFEKTLERDPVKTVITGISELGLVEMTRKRTSASLGQRLCEPCPVCEGKGRVKSVETICYEALRELTLLAEGLDFKKIVVRAAPNVIERFLDEESVHMADLEAIAGCPIEMQVETLYSQEHFDIVPL